jgi:hypothetical protein
MEAPLTPESAAIEQATDPLRAYRTWAARLFSLLAALATLSIVLVVAAQAEALITITYLAIGLASLVTLALLVVALGRAEPWAMHAIAPACYLIIVFGVLRVIVALGSGAITIPLEVFGGLLVLSRPHPTASLPVLGPSDRWKLNVVIGVMLVTQLLPYVVTAVATRTA